MIRAFVQSRFKTNLYSDIKVPQWGDFFNDNLFYNTQETLLSGTASKPKLEFVQGLLYLIEGLPVSLIKKRERGQSNKNL